MRDQPTPEQTPERIAPPAHIVAHAAEMARNSPCRSQRGAVAFVPRNGGSLVSAGWNRRQHPPCDGSAECKQTCGRTALHAEQAAILDAGTAIEGADVLHVKVSHEGCVVASGGPSCLECSKLMLAAGVSGVWLFHDTGWRRYDIEEFHRLTLASADALTATLAHLTQENERLADRLGTAQGTIELLKSSREQAEATLATAQDEAQENWQSFRRVKQEKFTLEATLARVKALSQQWRSVLHPPTTSMGHTARAVDVATNAVIEAFVADLDAALVDPPVSSSTETKT